LVGHHRQQKINKIKMTRSIQAGRLRTSKSGSGTERCGGRGKGPKSTNGLAYRVGHPRAATRKKNEHQDG